MRPDGNLVVADKAGRVHWQSGTAGSPGAQLEMRLDGEVVIARAGTVLWKGQRSADRLTLLDSGTIALHDAQAAATAKKLATVPVAERATVPASWYIGPAVIPKPTGGGSGTTTPPSVALPGGRAFMLHMLRRTTFGFTSSLTAEVAQAGGIGQWLDQQLAPSSISDPVDATLRARFPNAAVDPPAAWANWSNGSWDGMIDLAQLTLARQIWSKRQLFEVMVDFWSNHLNITTPSSEPWDSKMWDDRNVIRKFALGRFEDMLLASTRSPAMLNYLSNASSQGSAPNENYGRELLELHTVGVDAGYGHDGVINVARTLSGYTVWNKWNGGTAATNGTFWYRPAWHYVGPVQVLGWSHPNASPAAGDAAGRSLVKYLANHPATATRIATKLATRFVSDNPPASLVSKLADVYLKNGTATIPVLKALFASDEFAASVGSKVRRPAEDVIATARTLGVTPDPAVVKPDGIGTLYWIIYNMGNAPLGWDPPNGYPDVAAAWSGAGTTLNKWNAHMAVAGHWTMPGLSFRSLPDYLLGPTKPTTRGALIDVLTGRLLPGQTVSAAHRAALIAFLGADGPIKNGDLSWMFGPLVSMVLNSPYWSVR
jgi:uncharacterized protein (DUF1800 family)